MKAKHVPRKRFGQNFLNSGLIIQNIVDAIHPTASDHVIEIGPGQGALTAPLLQRAGTLDCLEIDRDLVTSLEKKFAQHSNFKVHSVDALKFDFNTLNAPAKSLRIVGNLPYNITTPLLFHLLSFCPLIHDMHFMLQKEVVDRLTAHPNSKAFGKLTLMIQYYCKAEYLFSVPSSAFYPAPKVESAVIRLTPYLQIPFPVKNFNLFTHLASTAFNQRRKILSNSLKAFLALSDFQALSLDPQKRPEALSLEEWVKLCNFVAAREQGQNLEHKE